MIRAVALGGLIALAAGCSLGSREIDHASVEQAIRRSIESQGGKLRSITCPSGREARKGARFDCAVVFTDGKKARAHVTLADDAGHFDYTMEPAR
jgi:hypothetical protein